MDGDREYPASEEKAERFDRTEIWPPIPVEERIAERLEERSQGAAGV